VVEEEENRREEESSALYDREIKEKNEDVRFHPASLPEGNKVRRVSR